MRPPDDRDLPGGTPAAPITSSGSDAAGTGTPGARGDGAIVARGAAGDVSGYGAAAVLSGAPDDGNATDAEAVEPLIWLEDGVEQPFEAMTELGRPWLEESSSWGSGGTRRGLPDDEEGRGSQEIIWL